MAHTSIDVRYKTHFNNGNDNGGEVQIQGSLVGAQPNPPKDNYYQFVHTFWDSQNVETSQSVFYISEKKVADLIKLLQGLITP